MRNLRFYSYALLALIISFVIQPAMAQPSASNSSQIAPLDRFRPAIDTFTISYTPDQVVFDEQARNKLRFLARRLNGTEDKILITAHSGTAQIPTHEAVTLSLRRALEIRNYLIQLGVVAEHVDVDAQGPAPEGQATDSITISQQ